jgi:hypothetical protein
MRTVFRIGVALLGILALASPLPAPAQSPAAAIIGVWEGEWVNQSYKASRGPLVLTITEVDGEVVRGRIVSGVRTGPRRDRPFEGVLSGNTLTIPSRQIELMLDGDRLTGVGLGLARSDIVLSRRPTAPAPVQVASPPDVQPSAAPALHLSVAPVIQMAAPPPIELVTAPVTEMAAPAAVGVATPPAEPNIPADAVPTDH